jgi:hypothetical protein
MESTTLVKCQIIWNVKSLFNTAICFTEIYRQLIFFPEAETHYNTAVVRNNRKKAAGNF